MTLEEDILTVIYVLSVLIFIVFAPSVIYLVENINFETYRVVGYNAEFYYHLGRLSILYYVGIPFVISSSIYLFITKKK